MLVGSFADASNKRGSFSPSNSHEPTPFCSTSVITDTIFPTIPSTLQLCFKCLFESQIPWNTHCLLQKMKYPLRKAFRGAISCIKGTKKELLRDHSGGHIYTPTQGRKHIVHRNNWNTYSCRREEKKYEDERPNQHSTSQSCHRMMSWSSSGSPPEKRS